MGVKIADQRRRRLSLSLGRFNWAVIAMIVSATAWGMGTVMSKAALDAVPPVTLLVIQLSASTLTLWAVTFVMRIRFRLRDTRHGWTGIFEPGIAYLISLIGYQFTTASNAALVSSLEPIIILILAFILLRERIRRTTLALTVQCVIGVILITASPAESGSSLLGDLLVLVGTASAAVYVIFSRNSVSSVHPLPLAASQHTVGLLIAAFALLFALPLGEATNLAGVTTGAVLFAAFSGIVQYSLAFALYLTALKFIPATQAALYLTLIPIFGVGGGVIFLGESMTLAQIVGAGLIVVALVIFNWHSARRSG